jgi:ketosteroid isomerase-like protein
MNEAELQPTTSNDDEEIRKLVPLPFLSQGLDAYMTTWEKFFSSWSAKPAFDFQDVRVTAGKDVAFATAIGGCAGLDRSGKHEEVQFRLNHVSPKD